MVNYFITEIILDGVKYSHRVRPRQKMLYHETFLDNKIILLTLMFSAFCYREYPRWLNFIGQFLLLFISEFCVLLTLQCGDRESLLIQNGGLLAACCSTSHYVLVFLLCIPIGLAEITALPASSLNQFQYYLIQWNDNA